LDQKIALIKEKAVCDAGLYFGTTGDNWSEFEKVYGKAMGIKVYLNQTTGNFLVNTDILDMVYQNWKSTQPILTHSEADTVGEVIAAVRKYGKQTHVCHISSIDELEPILKAKEEGLPVTCGVCPHHLFLTEDDVPRLGSYGLMKPSLKSKKDLEFLWKHIKDIDTVESDHAPHTKEEKESEKPPFGVPGLETTLPLLLTAVKEGRLEMDDITRMCYTNPKKILHLSSTQNAEITVELDNYYELKDEDIVSRCGWTPYRGMKVVGKVTSASIRGTKAYENGTVLAKPGDGKLIIPVTI
ncbi:hypothetical protein HGB07_04920, partial [Candidatus Roizmanbacteria bacterium]|nr:hypothetical protein [Candidatus Roizmanbacteria bacterium]